MAEEENVAAAAAVEEEGEFRRTNLERRLETAAANLDIWMEAADEAAKITDRGMKETVKEAKVKSTPTKSTAFLSFLVGGRSTYRQVYNVLIWSAMYMVIDTVLF